MLNNWLCVGTEQVPAYALFVLKTLKSSIAVIIPINKIRKNRLIFFASLKKLTAFARAALKTNAANIIRNRNNICDTAL